MRYIAPTYVQSVSLFLCWFHLSKKCHPEDCDGSGPGSLPVWLFLLYASNKGGRAGSKAMA